MTTCGQCKYFEVRGFKNKHKIKNYLYIHQLQGMCSRGLLGADTTSDNPACSDYYRFGNYSRSDNRTHGCPGSDYIRRADELPEEVRGKEPIVPEGTDLAIWTYDKEMDGEKRYFAFMTRQNKPLFHQYYSSEQARDKHIEDILDNGVVWYSHGQVSASVAKKVEW